MKTAYVSLSIFAICLVLMSGIPFMSGGAGAYAKYARNTQTQSNTNNCSNDSNCAINSPQTQGDGTAISMTNLQMSKPSMNKSSGGVGQSDDDASMAIKTVIDCQVPPELEYLKVCQGLKKVEYRIDVELAVPQDFVANTDVPGGQTNHIQFPWPDDIVADTIGFVLLQLPPRNSPPLVHIVDVRATDLMSPQLPCKAGDFQKPLLQPFQIFQGRIHRGESIACTFTIVYRIF